MEQSKTNRIGYIDAMRGVAMILVVYSHISAYSFGSYTIAYNDILERLRMPVFFFISGWVFYKPRSWNWTEICQITSKKFAVQIVPSVVFMLLYLYAFDMMDVSALGSDKRGYWFTFVLFEFFLIYIGAEALLNRRNTPQGEMKVLAVILLISACAFYYATYYYHHATELGNWKNVLGFFSFVKIRHLVFFWFGTFVRRNFEAFVQLTDNAVVMTIIIIAFVITNLFPVIYSTNGIEYISYLFTGIVGITIFFTFFRKHQTKFSMSNPLGRTLQFIGQRTLDIYLLHYFVLPYNLLNIGAWMLQHNNKSLDALISLVIALWVIALSLLLSNVIRLSPFLGKHLFGAKS